ncbi:putative metalloprotease CJM1_0395 family protein [Oceanospirillum sp.]|uniref:putative metalloprotease CJM1_0395 family protein n=1 Tax=Oceanospirillum sp. TaxID=2021254 RepID=UPI003A9365AD
METPSVSSSTRYARLVQDYREKERSAEAVNASASEQADIDSEKALLEQEKNQVISELSKRDQEVRTHEEAHASVGGRYASSPSYDMTEGPDGREYAVGGQVTIDTSPVPDDPEATLDKSQVVERAALAPAQPSEQDLKVAAEARAMGNEARVEIRERDFSERVAESGNTDDSSDAGSIDESSQNEPDEPSLQFPSGIYKEPKSFSFGLSFPQSFVGSQESAAGMTVAQQLKDRFDTMGLSFPPQPLGQQVAVTV